MSRRPAEELLPPVFKRSKSDCISDLSTRIRSHGQRLFPPCALCSRNNSACFYSADSTRCASCISLQRRCSASSAIHRITHSDDPFRLVDLRSLAAEFQEKHSAYIEVADRFFNEKNTDKKFDSIEKNTEKTFDSIGKNFDFMEKNFDSMETRFQNHIDLVNDKFDIWKRYVDAEVVRVQSRSESLAETVQHLSSSVLSDNHVPWAAPNEVTDLEITGPSAPNLPNSPCVSSSSFSIVPTTTPSSIASTTNVPKSAFVAALPDSLFAGDCDASNDLSMLDFPIERPPSEPTAPIGLSDPSSPDFDTFLNIFSFLDFLVFSFSVLSFCFQTSVFLDVLNDIVTSLCTCRYRLFRSIAGFFIVGYLPF
ncbi:hypothetical protein V8E54_003644 [Elaphomyces granulatus]